MNWSANPCDDFFEFSCGGWADNFTLAPDASIAYLYNNLIIKDNQHVIEDIVNDPNHPHVHEFYLACMDTARIDAQGIQPVVGFWSQVDAVATVSDFARMIAIFHSSGFATSLFQWIVDIDPNSPPTLILQFQQGGLSLPDPTYYSVSSLIPLFLNHVTRLLVLYGEDPTTAATVAQDVLAFERVLASITMPANNLTDPFALYNPVDVKGLKSLCPSFDWDTYLLTLTSNTSYGVINVITPPFFQSLAGVLSGTPLSTLKSYLKWSLAHNTAKLLSQKVVAEDFSFFGKVIGGLDSPPTRESVCISAIDGDLGDLLGVYYGRKVFPPEARAVAKGMVEDVEQAMRTRLNTLDWMDGVTRSRALDKLSLIANYIGYPDHLRNISFPIQAGYFDNVLQAALVTSKKAVAGLGTPADRGIWSMTADTINAYYDPTRNEMVFPAAILQYPFFDLTIPPELNYGGTAATMGHELTHGFDNSGRDYDGNGRLVDWWQPATSREFLSRVQCVIDQYSTFEVLPGVFIDGKLTQGENVADLGGIKSAYQAYSSRYPGRAPGASPLPGLTNAQLFFVAYAQGWCAVARPEYLRNQVKVDVHSWAKYRVLGPLMNFPTFASSFNCPVGSRMNPTSRCVVW